MLTTANTYNPNFQANIVSKCGGMTLYRLCDKSDYDFLQQIPKKIHTKDLMPNLSKQEYKRWDEMIEYAHDNALDDCNITYLEAYKNKLCGIVTYWPSGNITFLDCICTWPVEFGKKVRLAGKNLFLQVFEDFLQNKKAKKIKLEAITNGPTDTVTKYKQLGFIPTTPHKTKIDMEINRCKVQETVKILNKILFPQKVEGEEVNLFEELDL